MEQDAAVKRARFIQSANETRELFKWVAPAEVIKATNVYSTSFYGSNLWDLEWDKAKQVNTAWIITVKLAWGCPHQTRTYIISQRREAHNLAFEEEIDRMTTLIDSLVAN
jgi:hypothetical protein